MTSLQRPLAEVADQGPAPPGAGQANGSLAEVIRTQQHAIWRFLRLLGADQHEADDLMQDTFVRYAEGQRRGERVAAPAAFLRGIARNLLIAARRRARHQPPSAAWVDAVGSLAQAEPEQFADGRVDALRHCVQRLPERARRAIEWHHVEGVSRKEIARRLDLGDEGVKSLLDRARELLRRCVEQTIAVTTRGDDKP